MAEAASESSNTLALVAFAFLIGIFGVIAFALTKFTGEEKKEEEPKKAAGGQKRRGALDKMQKGAAASAAAAADGSGDESAGDEDGGDRVGRRNAQKDQKKQEKKEQAQQEKQMRQEQENKKSEGSEKYGKKLADKEAARLKKEEDELLAEEEKAKQEKEEFDKWKEMFAVDAEGEADAGTKDENAVENFVNYVKLRKVVNLEDLAANFKMKTSSAIDRLKQLEKLERLSGIFDDRGKYVYITEEEMVGVAAWCKQKGRISRGDLVAACNRIVRLNPTEDDKAKLEQEARSAADQLDETAEADN